MHSTPSAVCARRTRRDRAVQAGAEGLLDGLETPVAAFVDLAGIGESARALHAARPSEAEVLHAFATKANPLVPVLAQLRGHGVACEVSSP